MKKPFNIMQHYHYVPSERKRGLDALSVSERLYHRPNNNSFVRFKEQGLAPVPGLSFVNISLSTPRNGGLSPIPSR